MSYTLDRLGIYRPEVEVTHRNDEYEESGFDTLLKMQVEHFWYVGRHQFLMGCLKRHLTEAHQSMIDLGGGVGGWIRFLVDHSGHTFNEIALGDSSSVALLGARKVLPENVSLFQVDLMSTQWTNRWDVVFLLDVIEHCPDDVSIVRQVFEALKPGGVLIVTTPALRYFWSHNDEHAKHLRRYSVADYKKLASLTKFTLVDARYFMFFLSPLYWLSRKAKPKNLTQQELKLAIQTEHEVPHPMLNLLLTKIFSAERFVGHRFAFPWGTSILGVFQKK